MFRAYIYKVLHSPLFFIGISGSAALCFISMYTTPLTGQDVYTRLGIFLDVDAYRKIIAVFAALPFAANFADEWRHGVTNQLVTRIGAVKYAVANAGFCFVTSFLAVFAGMMLFLAGYSLAFPVYASHLYEGTEQSVRLYGEFLENGMPWLYIALRTFFFALSCGMWSVMGLAISAFFPNRYVAVCSPLITCYVVERITIQLPDMFNLWYLSTSIYKIGNSLITFIYTLLVFVLLSAALSAVFVITVKRRTQNELV